MASQPAKVTAVVVVLVILFGIVSISTPSWLNQSGRGVTVNLGLFTGCASSSETSDCNSLSDVPGWWQAVQGLAVTHVVLQVCAAVLLFIGLKQEKKMLAYTGTALTVIAGILLLAAVATFGAKTAKVEPYASFSLGYSFYLSVTTVVLVFIATGCAFLASRAIE